MCCHPACKEIQVYIPKNPSLYKSLSVTIDFSALYTVEVGGYKLVIDDRYCQYYKCRGHVILLTDGNTLSDSAIDIETLGDCPPCPFCFEIWGAMFGNTRNNVWLHARIVNRQLLRQPRSHNSFGDRSFTIIIIVIIIGRPWTEYWKQQLQISSKQVYPT